MINMKGLYFYKLVSPYSEDTTKDCKLSINEIDHNFLTLKDVDVKDFYLDSVRGFLVLETNNGEKFQADLTHYTKDVFVKFDKEDGMIEIHHDGVVDVIDGLITKENISREIETNIVTDASLRGNGGKTSPLGLTTVEKTSSYKSVIKVIDMVEGFSLPCSDKNKLGDRYLTLEEYNEHGYLYTYPAALRLVRDLNSDWRIPSKEDWDNMLNAIEICEGDKNHDVTSCNNTLGKLAGKYLKSKEGWVKMDECHHHMCKCEHAEVEADDIFMEGKCMPKPKPISPIGVDSYGMNILPSGYGDGDMMMDYFGRRAKFWTSTDTQVTNLYVKRFDFDKSGVVQVAENPRGLASLRLVKNYDGNNYRAVETINGVNYNTVLMPTENTTHGFTIWLANNVAASQCKYAPVLPNNGDALSIKNVYFINEWNGFDWDKKELQDGDSLVIQFGPDGSKNEEYRLVDGKLMNVKKDIIATVENKYDNDIDDLQARVDVLEGNFAETKEILADINNKIGEFEALHEELKDTDTKLKEAISNETTERENAIQELKELVNSEIERSIAEDEQIKGRLISQSGSTYSNADGVITLVTDDPTNTIVITLDSNYGTF